MKRLGWILGSLTLGLASTAVAALAGTFDPEPGSAVSQRVAADIRGGCTGWSTVTCVLNAGRGCLQKGFPAAGPLHTSQSSSGSVLLCNSQLNCHSSNNCGTTIPPQPNKIVACVTGG
jgi:hypothetical protein